MRKFQNIITINKDCLLGLQELDDKVLDIVITSPPYNLKIKYNSYVDNKKREDYLNWIETVFLLVKRKLKDKGSLFINMGSSNIDPWISTDVADCLRKSFYLQNNIIWVKSISIKEKTYGHFKPINSKRFLNNLFENIYHFTKTGNINLNRESIGVPYVDKSNIKRWGKKQDKRCKGNCWFIPYKTIINKKQKGNHPATFPEELVENCINLHGFTKDLIVCDPFMGTGTTLVVSKKLGITGIGFEIDTDYIKYAKGRLEKIT